MPRQDGDSGKGKSSGGSGKGKSSRGGGGGGGASSSPTTLPCALKLLAPEALAAAIIGKQGSVIAAIRTNCQARLALTEYGEVYPSTECRVLTAQASTEEQLNNVVGQILEKLEELVSQSNVAETCGVSGELKLKALVPRAAVGGVIGKSGESVKALRESSGAKISIGEPAASGPSADQTVSVTGDAEALEKVLAEVNKQIQALNGESWFSAWVMNPGVQQAGNSAFGANQSYLGSGGWAAQSPGVDLMIRTALNLPPYVMEDSRGFALSCHVPNSLVGGLIGRGGSGTKEIQSMTGTKIGIREIPDDNDNRSLNITGPLANSCAAYMLMMKRYLDAEAQQASW
uniref:K Homology domain-containing protein n=1 Tax=Zooxanthella nutricula TaxID=1333877 RepID=A0A7S2PK00_9DINO